VPSGVGEDERRGRLREVAAVFATLGLIGFGGPAAHIGLIRRETVERRRWLDDARLVDLVGLTSIIPGPNSTELAMLVGRERAGGWGLVVAGLAFIIPAAAIVLCAAWAYVAFGATPAVDGLLYGIKPVVLAIVAVAIVAFARTALAGPLRLAIGVAVAALWFAGIHELALLAGGALVMAVDRGVPARAALGVPSTAAGMATMAAQGVDLALLAGVFLKAGALLFGSGYVLLAFIRGDLVERLGWLTDAQLLDAVAIGQVTPGPLFTTATFVGYLLAGLPGAVVATVAIFAPAFVFTALVARVADRIRARPLTAALLDGLNAAAVGLMAVVSVQLAATAIVDPLTLALGIGALIGLALRLPSVALVAAGAMVGLAATAVGIGL
jgi:chromate transporter